MPIWSLDELIITLHCFPLSPDMNSPSWTTDYRCITTTRFFLCAGVAPVPFVSLTHMTFTRACESWFCQPINLALPQHPRAQIERLWTLDVTRAAN